MLDALANRARGKSCARCFKPVALARAEREWRSNLLSLFEASTRRDNAALSLVSTGWRSDFLTARERDSASHPLRNFSARNSRT
jgi:hypothetical protein